MRRLSIIPVLLVLAALPAPAQPPVIPPPPTPYAPTPEERQALDGKKAALAERLKALTGRDTADAAVFLHIAEMADRLRLYTNRSHVAGVLRGLETGLQRAEGISRGERPWMSQPGRTLRGLVSRIDGSVQPYGVVLPASFNAEPRTPQRLDVVLHGRGPTEVTFLQQFEPAPGSAAARAPEQPFIELHPFGRGNNGWRWAGETDVFEALHQVQRDHVIDPDRIVLRGFSMGGHGAWHLGVHYPDRWAAVSPGAGFSETRNYLKLTEPVPAYQERAWHIYDAVDYALNLFNTPFVAYGGEKDPQLQAALNMREAAAKEGLALNVVVGPNTGHSYHPESLKEIMRAVEPAKRDPNPARVRFTTWTLKYNQCHWVAIDALEEHYRRATVSALAAGATVGVKTDNVTGITLGPLPEEAKRVEIDGTALPVSRRVLRLARVDGKWTARRLKEKGFRKRHGLQGPIDDAFMERFLVVRGTGTPWSPATGTYADAAIRRFREEWRLGFRGELPVKDDADLVPGDWKNANLVLFGDPQSNSVLAKIAGKLPIRWTRDGLVAGGRTFPPDAVPALIYPNPLNPERYVVINSGHTWTEREILASNANLTPKLPDWAVLRPGDAALEVLSAGFFDEQWRLP